MAFRADPEGVAGNRFALADLEARLDLGAVASGLPVAGNRLDLADRQGGSGWRCRTGLTWQTGKADQAGVAGLA